MPSPRKTTAGLSSAKQTRPKSGSPVVLEGPSKHWPFIEFIELQYPNYDLCSPHQHPHNEKKYYNGSELKISKDGYDNLITMHIEVKKRTPESKWDGSEYFYDHDCEAHYGMIEVLENQILEYEREREKPHSKLKLYAIVEALAFFQDYYGRDWKNVCEYDRVEGLICLMGALFTDWFRELAKETPIDCWLAPPDESPLKNLGLIKGLATRFAAFKRKTRSMKLCIKEIEKIAASRGIQLRDCDGPIERDEIEEPDFGAQLKRYKSEHGGFTGVVGGNKCVLSPIPDVEKDALDKGDVFEI